MTSSYAFTQHYDSDDEDKDVKLLFDGKDLSEFC